MISITADDAQNRLLELIDETGLAQGPVQVVGRQRNAILIAEEDWRFIRNILYLNSPSALLGGSTKRDQPASESRADSLLVAVGD